MTSKRSQGGAWGGRSHRIKLLGRARTACLGGKLAPRVRPVCVQVRGRDVARDDVGTAGMLKTRHRPDAPCTRPTVLRDAGVRGPVPADSDGGLAPGARRSQRGSPRRVCLRSTVADFGFGVPHPGLGSRSIQGCGGIHGAPACRGPTSGSPRAVLRRSSGTPQTCIR